MSPLPILQPEPSPAAREPERRDDFVASVFPYRLYIDTFGCQMNEHDSQRMVSLMAGEGYAQTFTPDDADLIILNSCSIREKAEQKLRSEAGKMRAYKQNGRKVVFALAGCVAAQEGKRLLERVHHADIVFGPDHIGALPEMVRKARSGRVRICQTEFYEREDYKFPELSDQAPVEVSAYVSVMKGCDKYCTYCIVPSTRGREVSRTASEILDEVRRLVDKGTKEIVLLGQTVNSYGRLPRQGQVPFHELLSMVNEVSGLERIRFTSPHPADFSDAQITAFGELDKLCPHMHLPVQSGSSRVLRAMKRGYTREAFLDVVRRFRETVPSASLTTDVIVGFPSETEAEFEETLSLFEEVRFQGAFSFTYSERTGTKAVDLEPSVPIEERFRRLRVLQDLQDRITEQQLLAKVGEVHPVLIEGPSKSNPARSSGRTGTNLVVHIDGSLPAGTVLAVEITEALKHSLLGRAHVAEGV